MKSIFFAMAIVILTAGCSPKIVQSSSDIRDSVRVEYRERVIRDTAYVEIPFIKEVNVTRDTMSHIENDYAKSDAVVSDGVLSHSLETKKQYVPAPVVVTVRDTVIVREKAKTIIEEKIVEVDKPIGAWTRWWRNLGYLSAAALAVWLAIKVISNRSALLTFFKKLLSLH